MNFETIEQDCFELSEKNGPKVVTEKLIEETVELLAEITKDRKHPEKIREELSDTFIMVLQAMKIYGISSCEEIIKRKIERTKLKLGHGETVLPYSPLPDNYKYYKKAYDGTYLGSEDI